MDKQLKELLTNTNNNISLLANASSFIMHNIADLSWVGFYIVNGEMLELGPFQGRPACLKIKFGKGVCGKVAITKETMIVNNVHLFPGHIACDASSNSEIVIPIFFQNKLYGLLDIDSTTLNRFTVDDQQTFERFVEIIEENLI